MKAVFIGLGRMGSNMARRILSANLPLTVYNRTADKAELLAEAGAAIAQNPQQAFSRADLVITMVSDDLALTSILTSENLKLLSPGAIHVSMSTISVGLAESLTASHADLGHTMLSCPVFGRPAAAESGSLHLCLAGPSEAKEKVRAYLMPMGTIWDLGDKPAGANGVKLAGNFMIASLIETLSEAFSLVENHGVNPESFFELMSGTLFNAPAVKTYGKLILDGDFENAGFLAALGAKDVRLLKEAARNSQTPMPFASIVEDRFLRILARGWGNKDWCVIGQIQREDAGLA
jgi:3-hydroxyisobutyrate dehydrogenase-like beta-hydroxyacid dehydrogenase